MDKEVSKWIDKRASKFVLGLHRRLGVAIHPILEHEMIQEVKSFMISAYEKGMELDEQEISKNG